MMYTFDCFCLATFISLHLLVTIPIYNSPSVCLSSQGEGRAGQRPQCGVRGHGRLQVCPTFYLPYVIEDDINTLCNCCIFRTGGKYGTDTSKEGAQLAALANSGSGGGTKAVSLGADSSSEELRRAADIVATSQVWFRVVMRAVRPAILIHLYFAESSIGRRGGRPGCAELFAVVGAAVGLLESNTAGID